MLLHRGGELGTPVAYIIKMRHRINDPSVILFTIMNALLGHIYNDSFVAPCFELKNYNGGIVITTLGVCH